MANAEKERDTMTEKFAKEITAWRVIIGAGIVVFTVGMFANQVWGIPKEVQAIGARTTVLEQHHSADHVRLENMEHSQHWLQDTMFKLSEKVRVPDVDPPPVPIVVPSTVPHPFPSSTVTP